MKGGMKREERKIGIYSEMRGAGEERGKEKGVGKGRERGKRKCSGNVRRKITSEWKSKESGLEKEIK